MPGRTNLSFSSFPSFSSSSTDSSGQQHQQNSFSPQQQHPIGNGSPVPPQSPHPSHRQQAHHHHQTRSVSSWKSSVSRSRRASGEKAQHADPFSSALAPPADESAAERVRRLDQEAEAKRISDAIDEQLKAERQQQRKGKIVRVLLLGQSESGKSTTLRQFQRLYTPSAFREERIVWRAVIQLNLVRSVRLILDTLATHLAARSRSKSIHSDSEFESEWDPDRTELKEERDREWENTFTASAEGGGLASFGMSRKESDGNMNGEFEFLRGRGGAGPGAGGPSGAGYAHADMASLAQSVSTKSRSVRERNGRRGRMGHGGVPTNSNSTINGMGANGPSVSAHLHEMTLRLLPLRHIEQLLIAKLVPPSEDEATNMAFRGQGHSGSTRRLFVGIGGGGGEVIDDGEEEKEVFVRPGLAWKGYRALGRGRGGSVSKERDSALGGKGKARDFSMEDEVDEQTRVLNSCQQDIQNLWNDQVVREVLRRRKVRLEERPGFFLNDLERITSLKYMPTDDDVLRARLKTVGVSEHRFHMEAAAGRESGTEWRIVDVGGSRSQSPNQSLTLLAAKWIPYFEDVNAIIFLAPISGFDQVLSEDRTVNRLEDSVLLWRMICSNKLLANVELVLFLNKCDILEKKLRAGVRLAKYVKSFQDRSNDSETVQKYFRAKFAAIQREHSPLPRKFYGFCTSVTEITTTSGILVSVRDIVIREHLKRSKLL